MFDQKCLCLLPIVLLIRFTLQQCENQLENGIIDVTIGGETFPVLCEVESDGGGWTVILRRKDGSFDFSAPLWDDFAHTTQGSLEGEFFLALDYLHLLTKYNQMELLVRMRDGLDTAWAYYDDFGVGPEGDNYRLSISGYDSTSTAGDGLGPHDQVEWSSSNQDNDQDPNNNCAALLQSSWWFLYCYYANPLGVYGAQGSLSANAWNTWKGLMDPIDDITFKIRVARCQSGPGLMCDTCKTGYYLCTNSKSGKRSCCTNAISSCGEAPSSGMFDMLVNGNKEPVWCDKDTEGGGWTTILRRTDGSVNFASYGLADYASTTIGSPDNEFMISLNLLHTLTSSVRQELDVTITHNGVVYSSKYGLFSVGDEAGGFVLTVGEYSSYSTAGDALTPIANGMMWTTFDSDNDLSSGNCANTHSSAFWFGDCSNANPLGAYGDTTGKGVYWNSLFANTISLDSIEFKIRPNVCPNGPSKTCTDCGPGLYVCSIPGEGTSCCTQPITSCEEASNQGPHQVLMNGQLMLLYCDPSSADGGWTTILKRSNGAIDFSTADWNTCAHDGIGQVGTEFFLALDLIRELTQNGDMELLIEMREETHYAHAWFGRFLIKDQTKDFLLRVEDYDPGSPAGDALLNHNGEKFSTIDRDNDQVSGFCSNELSAPFWYKNCFSANPLGVYGDETGKGIIYTSFYPTSTSLQAIEFKVRKRRCAQGVGSTCDECLTGYYLCTTADGYLDCCSSHIATCQEARRSGIFDLVNGSSKQKVYCDMYTDGGGWVELLARRTGGVNDFYLQTFETFKSQGYGVVGGDNFLPLEFWNYYSNQQSLELLVEAQYNSTSYWALYQRIQVDGAVDQFVLHLGDYDSSSTLGNDLNASKGEAFSAIDRDNDSDASRHCADVFRRAFWSRSCSWVNPLGEIGNTNQGRQIYWHSLTGIYNTLDQIFFKARTNQCLSGFGSTCTSCSHGYALLTDQASGRTTCTPYCDDSICSNCLNTNPRICVGKCASGYYKDEANNFCKKCNSLCATCSSPSNSPCDSCTSDALFVPDTSTCTLTCPDKYYQTPDRECLPCSPDCSQCTDTTCLQCAQGYFEDSSGDCVSECPDGTYGNQSTRTCDVCNVGCQSCFGPSSEECFTCTDNYHFVQIFTCVPFCTSGNYFDPISQNCLGKMCQSLACHSDCAECFGGSSDECESCVTGRTLDINQCNRCEDWSGMKTNPANPSECLEICGDGIDLGLNECQDGNLQDDDGCSSVCTLESKYECHSVSSSGPFYCTQQGPPTIIQVEVTSELMLVITFSEPVQVSQMLTIHDVPLSVLTSYQTSQAFLFDPALTIYPNNFSTTIKIPLNFKSSLIGDQFLQIQFLSPYKIKDLNQNQLTLYSSLITQLPSYEYYTEVEHRIINSTTSIFSTATLRGVGINLLLFLAVYLFCDVLWSLTNFVQLVNFLPAINVAVPYNVKQMFSLLAIANLNIQVLENAFNDWVIQKEKREVFLTSSNLNVLMPYKLFLLNESVLLFSWLFFFILLGFLALIQRQSTSQRCKRKLAGSILRLTHSAILFGLMESALELLLASLLSLEYLSLDSPLQLLSSLLSFLLLGLILILPFCLLNVFSRNDFQHPTFVSRYKELGSVLKISYKSKVLELHFYSVFVIRRLCFILIIFFLARYPKLQTILLASLSILMIMYLLFTKPFKEKFMNSVELMNECFLLMIILFLSSLQFSHLTRYNASSIGWICVVIVILGVFVNFIVIVPQKCKKTLKRWRKKEAQKKESNKICPRNSSRSNFFQERCSLSSIQISVQKPSQAQPQPLFTKPIPRVAIAPDILRRLEVIPEQQSSTPQNELRSMGDTNNSFFYI